MNEKRHILREIFYFSGSKYVNQFVKLLSSLLVARMLGPHLKGVWAALNLIVIYSVYIQAGTMISMVRQVPLFRSQDKMEKVKRIQDSVFTFNFFVALLLASVVFGISFFLPGGEKASTYAAGLRFIALIAFLFHMNNFVVDFLRSERRFIELSKYNLLFEVTGSILALVLVFFLSLNGIFIAKICAGIFALLFVFPKVFKKLRLRIHLSEILELLPVGIPLLVIAFAFLLFYTVDRFMILRFIGVTELGYYSIAIMMVNTLLFVPYSVSNVFYPRMVEEFGREGIQPSLWRYIRVPGELVSRGMALLIGFFLVLAPWGIHLLLPAFYPGVHAALFLMVGIFFYSVSLVPANFLVTVKRLKSYLAIVLGCVFFSLFLDYFFIQLGWGLLGIGLGTSIAYMVFSGIILFYVSSFFLYKRWERIIFLGKLYLPILYLLLAGVAAFATAEALGLPFWNLTHTKTTLLKLFFLFVFSVPLLRHLIRRTGLSIRDLPILRRRTGMEVAHDAS